MGSNNRKTGSESWQSQGVSNPMLLTYGVRIAEDLSEIWCHGCVPRFVGLIRAWRRAVTHRHG